MDTKTVQAIKPVSNTSARSLLLTLLGEFVLPDQQPVFTATLLAALAGTGIQEKAGRQAISRAAASGWIDGQKVGRQAAWLLTEKAKGMIADGTEQVKKLGSEGSDWDGNWIVLHITLPESRRVDRVKLYRILGWIGFGNPTPGVWVCPDSTRLHKVKAAIASLDLDTHTLAFSAQTLDFGIPADQLIRQAWDLDAVALHYKTLLASFKNKPGITTDQKLFQYIKLVNAIQRAPAIDPRLPSDLLPEKWPGHKLVSNLTALRREWRTGAHQRWAQLRDTGR